MPPQDPYAEFGPPVKPPVMAKADPYAEFGPPVKVPAASKADPYAEFGPPVAAPKTVASTTPAPSQPSLGQVLTQPTDKTDKEYLGYTGPAGVAGATIHGLNNVANGTVNAARSMWDMITKPPQNTTEKGASLLGGPIGLIAARTISPLVDVAKQVPEIPGAIRDINASPDPLAHYADAAQDTAAQGAGQALVGAGTEGLGKIIHAATSPDLLQQAQKATSDFTKAIPPTKSTPYAPEDAQAARPYLEQEHATSPIKTVVNARDAADASIKGIENQVSQRIAQNPAAVIKTKPLDAVRTALAPTDALKSGFLDAGLKELKPYNLDQPMTVAKADAMRRLFNTENSAFAASNKYDVGQARATSPAYAAREAAVASLRDGVYQALDDQGFHDVQKLRRDEGSLLKIRDAAQNQIFNGDKNVGGTGPNSRIGRNIVRVGATGSGAAIGHAVAGGPGATAGAIVGGGLGESINSALFPGNLSQDALVARSFSAAPLQIAPPGSLAGIKSAAVPPAAPGIPRLLRNALRAP